MNDLSVPLLRYALASFITLLVVVDPFGIVPLFSGLTGDMTATKRGTTLNRAIIIAFAIALFFLIAGRAALAYLGVSVNAFAISGGILLFGTALPMLFGQRAGLQAPEPGEATDTDIAVFPLAIPLLSGPDHHHSFVDGAGRWQFRASCGAGCRRGSGFAASWLLLHLGSVLMARIGEGGVHRATRVLGVVLAALAVQFVLNGVTAYIHTVGR